MKETHNSKSAKTKSKKSRAKSNVECGSTTKKGE